MDRKERKRAKKYTSSRRHKAVKNPKKADSKIPETASKVTTDDYFRRQTEFRVWLTQTKHKYIEDLSTAEALHIFQEDFMRQWNRGHLAQMFYDGLPAVVVEHTKRTRHCWGFVAQLGEKEKFELATAKDAVDVATQQSTGIKQSCREDGKAKRDRDEELRDVGVDNMKKRSTLDRRRAREDRDRVLDELEPKATGRDALIQKRREVSARLHGAAVDKEEARAGLDWSEDFLMGGRSDGADDLKRRLVVRDVARRRKQEEQEKKVGALKAKESARMDKFLKDMGLTGPNADGRPLTTIAPRR